MSDKDTSSGPNRTFYTNSVSDRTTPDISESLSIFTRQDAGPILPGTGQDPTLAQLNAARANNRLPDVNIRVRNDNGIVSGSCQPLAISPEGKIARGLQTQISAADIQNSGLNWQDVRGNPSAPTVANALPHLRDACKGGPSS